jgi:hypothetical protein
MRKLVIAKVALEAELAKALIELLEKAGMLAEAELPEEAELLEETGLLEIDIVEDISLKAPRIDRPLLPKAGAKYFLGKGMFFANCEEHSYIPIKASAQNLL